MERAEDIDSLCKTKNFDSLGKVKKTLIVLTKDPVSLWNVKKTMIVLKTKDSDSLKSLSLKREHA